MTWLLIVATAVGPIYKDFPSEQACRAAQMYTVKRYGDVVRSTVCVEKPLARPVRLGRMWV